KQPKNSSSLPSHWTRPTHLPTLVSPMRTSSSEITLRPFLPQPPNDKRENWSPRRWKLTLILQRRELRSDCYLRRNTTSRTLRRSSEERYRSTQVTQMHTTGWDSSF